MARCFLSRPSASNSGGFGLAQPALRRGKEGGPLERQPLPTRRGGGGGGGGGGGSAPRVLKVKKKKAVRRVNAPDVKPEKIQIF